MSTGNEELKTTDNLPFEESQTSKKSVKAKKTALRPTSKKKNGENTDANSEKHIEESNKKIATAGTFYWKYVFSWKRFWI